MNHLTQGILFLFFLLWSYSASLAQERGIYSMATGEDKKNEIVPVLESLPGIFQEEEIINLEIHSDFKTLYANKDKEPELQPAKLRMVLGDSIEIFNDIRVELRGNYRRKNCNMPPLKLNFKKTKFFVKSHDMFKKLKLVGVCRKDKLSEQYLLKEYLCYKLLNTLTENSFRVRLFWITYVDTGGKYKPFSEYAFVIEDIPGLERRLNMEKLDVAVGNQDATELSQMNLVSVFEYMIGNTDWSVPGLHNIKLLKGQDPKPLAIPYDFDFCGLVNADYAVTSEIIGTEDVRVRVYRGICNSAKQMEPTFERFRQKKSELFGLAETIPGMKKATINYVNNYLKGFYSTLENPKSIERAVTTNCQ